MTKLKLSTLAVFLVGMTMGAGLLLANATNLNGENRNPGAVALETPQPPQQELGAKSEGKPAETPADDLARKMWAILEVVEKNQRQPPPRQEVISNGAHDLLEAANVDPHAELARRVKDIDSEDKLRTLLREIWPKDKAATKAAALKLRRRCLTACSQAFRASRICSRKRRTRSRSSCVATATSAPVYRLVSMKRNS